MRSYAIREIGNIAGLGERERQGRVKGIMRPGSWTYPRVPFDRAAERAAREAKRQEFAA